MENEINEIWYACYGSNIRKERFMCYINGGTPPGALRNFTGCSDKSEPKDSRTITIDHEMYFAMKSPTWNGGGICFLKPEKDPAANTLGRTYLINSSQFIDLVRQELKFEGEIVIDFEELVKQGSYNCMTDGRYGLLLYLGEIDGKPVVSFTSENYLRDEINPPHEAYLTTIIKGLNEIYHLDEAEIIEYFSKKEGIRDLDIKDQLKEILKFSN
ncbi:hypothetical protein [Christiangramia forsetii]|uniref:Histone deacetylase n=2 Tax=Christiangramia forsetii TaxID=411153 RepID=A0M6Y1_CHRFK|nr:hypothetical protein [Christiangramia forsetii]GGG29228.1 hypothetical protein GCM10011532_10870 [Christiangramia forsetii]CAL68376.1 conserved hypothetical protein [Christiangramia forsetii KT0803]